jgi:hypothetical protein
MSELEIDLKESLVDIFWWNSKLFKRTLFHIGKKQNFLGVFKMKNWEVKIRSKEHLSFKRWEVIIKMGFGFKITHVSAGSFSGFELGPWFGLIVK